MQERIQNSATNTPFFIETSNSARHFLLAQGTNFRCSARPLARAIECLLVQPLSSLVATGQIHPCDRIRITHIGASPVLTFLREVHALAESPSDKVAT